MSRIGRRKRVVIAEPFAEDGLTVLREAGIEVDLQVGRSRAELIAALAGADGLIVRSGTQVNRELLAAAPQLAVIGRAGVGTDTIDVGAATAAGIVVLNTPGANRLAATEHTFALMLALARRTPLAVQQLRSGIWDRNRLTGTELAGKTLGIVGFGQIGRSVATRAVAFEMPVLVHDPYLTPATAHTARVSLVGGLAELLNQSDIVTLHVPLTPETDGIIDAVALRMLRPHAYLINCARGDLIVERDLLAALDANVLAGAALDVMSEEPPPEGGVAAALLRHPKVIVTPHIGGSTGEALRRVATELANDILRVLRNAHATGAVNAPMPAGAAADRVLPFVDVAYCIGRFYRQYVQPMRMPKFNIILGGALAGVVPDSLKHAFLNGLLQTTGQRVSIVNAEAIARNEQIVVDVRSNQKTSGYASAYASSLRLVAEDKDGTTITGTSIAGLARIVELDGYEIDAAPSGAILITRHRDVPGMVGSVGKTLGDAEVNISTMQVSRGSDGVSIMVISTDRPADEPTLVSLRAIPGVASVRSLVL